jgi:hypothetical protein
MDFRFLDKSQPYVATMSIARALRWHPVANVLNYRYAMADFDAGTPLHLSFVDWG